MPIFVKTRQTIPILSTQLTMLLSMLLSSLYPTSKCCTGQLPTLARTPCIDVQAHVLAVTANCSSSVKTLISIFSSSNLCWNLDMVLVLQNNFLKRDDVFCYSSVNIEWTSNRESVVLVHILVLVCIEWSKSNFSVGFLSAKMSRKLSLPTELKPDLGECEGWHHLVWKCYFVWFFGCEKKTRIK